MKRVLILAGIIFISVQTQAQIGGLSASKLMTLCTSTVPQSTIEFEPSFCFSNASMQWNETGKKESIFATSDSSLITSGLAFRFTYGLSQKVEAGVSVSSNMTMANWGIKYNFLTKDSYAFALLGGINTPLGNRISNKNIKSTENALVGGFVTTINLSEKLNLDADVQYQRHLFEQTGHHQQDFFFNTDLGYYVVEKVQLVSGFNFSFTDRDISQYQLIFNPGVTIEKANNFILVMQLPYTVLGKNVYQNLGFGIALTIMID